jgi:hypothetical protein
MSTPRPSLPDALLRQALARRAAGPSSSSELLDDVMSAIETLPQRRGWGVLLVPQQRLLPVLIAAALLLAGLIGFAVGVGSGLVVDEPDDILTQRDIVAPFTGLPPEGATPSIPDTGELIFSFYAEELGSAGRGTDGLSMWLYEDGRLIWQREPVGVPDDETRLAFGTAEPTTAVIEQRLTPEGVELLRSEMIAVAQVVDEHRIGGGVNFRVLDYRDGAQLVELIWNDGWLPPRLASPASWLPPSAWADRRIGAYVPRRYAVCVDPRDARLPSQSRDLILANASNPEGEGGVPPCYLVPTEVARDVVAMLEVAGIHPEEYSSSLLVPDPSSPQSAPYIIVNPVSPDGEVMCLQCQG